MILILGLFSCVPVPHLLRQVVDENISFNQEIQKSVSFVGVQLSIQKGGGEEFTFREMRNLSLTKQSFDNISYAFISGIDQSIRSRLTDGKVDSAKVRKFLAYIGLKFNQIAYWHAPDRTIVLDNDNNAGNKDFIKHSDMYPDCLEFLKDNIGSDYYLVAVAQVNSFIMVDNENKYQSEPMLMLVLYNNEGYKVFSKLYCKKYEGNKSDIADKDHIVQLIQDSRDEINHDLSFLLSAAPKSPTLEDQYQEILKKGNISDNRFIDKGDGTIIDTSSGLMWVKNANITGRKMAWQSAVDYCLFSF